MTYLPEEALQIHTECKGSPMVISIIGSLMSENGRMVPAQRQTARWEYYLHNLKKRRYSESLKLYNLSFVAGWHKFFKLNLRQVSQGPFLPARQRHGGRDVVRREPGWKAQGEVQAARYIPRRRGNSGKGTS
jgi:hypothetical protein